MLRFTHPEFVDVLYPSLETLAIESEGILGEQL